MRGKGGVQGTCRYGCGCVGAGRGLENVCCERAGGEGQLRSEREREWEWEREWERECVCVWLRKGRLGSLALAAAAACPACPACPALPRHRIASLCAAVGNRHKDAP